MILTQNVICIPQLNLLKELEVLAKKRRRVMKDAGKGKFEALKYAKQLQKKLTKEEKPPPEEEKPKPPKGIKDEVKKLLEQLKEVGLGGHPTRNRCVRRTSGAATRVGSRHDASRSETSLVSFSLVLARRGPRLFPAHGRRKARRQMNSWSAMTSGANRADTRGTPEASRSRPIAIRTHQRVQSREPRPR